MTSRMARGGVLVVTFLAVVAVLIGLQLQERGSRAPKTASASTVGEPISSLSGDVDCGGSVDAVDALIMLRSSAGLPVNAPCAAPNGDVNCSGAMDGTDASLVLRYVAGLSVHPPGCQEIGARAVSLSLSKPASGTHLVAGEQAVVTVTLSDQLGGGLTRQDFATLNLYMYGPQETTETVTAAKLLNASTDRSKRPHHYIDLLTNAGVEVNGNVLTYTLKPVTDEKPGTYTVGVWAVQKADGLQQSFELADVQIGTAMVEKQIVQASSCAQCHRGADSGKMYMHHIDPTLPNNPNGNWAIDSAPVQTCKSCHNNDGYAAYRGDINNPTGPTTVRTADAIVQRVHGLHMGEELKNTFNTDPTTGNFRNYIGLIFPANVQNCAYCHADDRWKTQPSRQACTACHDKVWFGETTGMPATFEEHPGGPQPNDSTCSVCHPADSGGVKAIAEAHTVSQPMNQIDVHLTPPANGKFYVAGERPTAAIVIRNDNGNAIDHTKVNNTNFSTAAFYVYGPREDSKPVLTSTAQNGISKARASATNSKAASGTPKGWTFAFGDTFKIAVNGGPPQVLNAPIGLQTPDQVRDWLRANLTAVTVNSNNTAGTVNLRSNLQGANSRFEIYNSAVTTIMGWKPGPLPLIKDGETVGMTAGTTVEPFVIIGNLSSPSNDLRQLSDPLDYRDPRVTRNVGNITYPLDDVAGLTTGTYMIYAYANPVAGKVPDFNLKTGLGFTTFQVGTATPDKKVATNCTNCHANNIWHLDEGPIHAAPFDTDYCKACHDYSRYATGDSFSRLGGTSTSGWSGFGAGPLSRRIHGVHRGRYLAHPEEIYAGNPNVFNEVIFPQDVRNCTKCHSSETTGTWMTDPSRLACLSCHDSEGAKAHGALNTHDLTPLDPYGGDERESCTVCHGKGKEFAVDKVHNIAKPYIPPHPREPVE